MRRATPMTPRKRAAALLLTTILAGCAVGPDYVAPKTDLTAFHNLDAVEGRHTTTPAPELDRCWTGFNDPMLVTIVQRALDENLDLAAALAHVGQAREAASAAGAQLLPTVDLDASATAERQSVESPLGALAGSLPPGQQTMFASNNQENAPCPSFVLISAKARMPTTGRPSAVPSITRS